MPKIVNRVGKTNMKLKLSILAFFIGMIGLVNVSCSNDNEQITKTSEQIAIENEQGITNRGEVVTDKEILANALSQFSEIIDRDGNLTTNETGTEGDSERVKCISQHGVYSAGAPAYSYTGCVTVHGVTYSFTYVPEHDGYFGHEGTYFNMTYDSGSPCKC